MNQLLSMMDGVEQINNMIIFGLTNRLDMIDPALLRPGRFDIHLKIDLPDTSGRYEILKIHSNTLIANKLFDTTVDLHKLADLMDGYTGAELESVIKMTIGNVLGNNIDFNNITESSNKIENITITESDFLATIEKFEPMFKNKNNVQTELTKMIRHTFHKQHKRVIKHTKHAISHADHPMVCGISGEPRSGKTSVACEIGRTIGLEKVTYVSAAQLLNLTGTTKVDYLMEIFDSKQRSLIILDNIELIIEFMSEKTFNKTIAHIIKVLLNETKHHVIVTTSYYDRLSGMTILDSIEMVEKLESA